MMRADSHGATRPGRAASAAAAILVAALGMAVAVSASGTDSGRAAGASAGAVRAAGGGVGVQESSLRAEKTVEYRLSKASDLNAKVGPVKIESVEFSNLGRGYGKGGIGGRMRPSTGSEVSTTIRAHFLAENPSSDEWEVTFTLEFLDKAGKVIERVTRKSSWEGEAKPFDFDHELLEYVLPMVAEVRVKMEGRLD